MIINGGARSGGAFFSRHLLRADENERVSVVEIRGLAADNVPDAFHEMEAVASGTRVQNYFYHANMNTRADEHLTPEQWEQATDTLERELGLTGQPRFVVEHEKEGRTHRHVVWSRIDADSMTAISDAHNYRRHELAAREIEQAFDLAPVESVLVKDRETERPERRPQDWETFRGRDSGIDPHAMKAEITALWQAADSGQAFRAALEERGYILAKGDRRDFVVVDQAGDDHSLARRISGAKAAEIRSRMGDIDRDALPTVAEARELAREAADATDGDADRHDPPGSSLPQGEPEQPGNQSPAGLPELAGGFEPEDAAPLIREAGEPGGIPSRVSPWGAAWRAFADRAAHYADRLHAIWHDESGESSMRWLHLAKDAIGLALSRGENEHAAAELATDATATARAFIEQGQAPPDEHSGDQARPGEPNVEPPGPDQRPQEAGAQPIGSPSAFDAFAERFMQEAGEAAPEPGAPARPQSAFDAFAERLAQETWEAEQEPESPAAPEQEPDAPGYDGPDIG